QAKKLFELKLNRNDKGSYDLTSYAGLDIPESLDIYQIASTGISATTGPLRYNFGQSFSFLEPAARLATEDENKNISNVRMGKLGDLDGKSLVGIDSATTSYRSGFTQSNIVHLVARSGEIYLGNFDTGKVEKLKIGDRSDIETLCRDNYSYEFCPIYKTVFDRAKTGDEKTDADIKIISEDLIGYTESRLSRIGVLSVNVYDTKGKRLGNTVASCVSYFDEETANLRETRNFIENLPGILPVTLSYLTRDWFTPIETWQTLFLLPGSVANYATMYNPTISDWLYFENSSLSLFITIALLIWFAFSVKKYGISNRQRKFWQYLIILFGPAAFLAYVIARPKIVQVTCANCGKLRRPDQDRCHNCLAGWEMPQLKEVGWVIHN
ncbi:MAG: hypothetical protein JW745_10100, partial [Sedimentisphaerales bacterium]|nr:hypothetical protein [Sedimentisphaerales bacterium]